MKKNQPFYEVSDNPNVYMGLHATTTGSSGTVLTEKMLQETIDYIKSDEYAQKEADRAKFISMGCIIIGRALEQKIITVQEYFKLLQTININGGLIVSPKMHKRLQKVEMPIKYYKKFKKGGKYGNG